MSEGIKFLYQFSVGEYDQVNPGINVLSVTNTAAGDFDKLHLTTTPLRETWRSTDVNTPIEIVIEANDLATTVDTFALLNHNFSPDAVVLLMANTVNSFVVPAITLAFNYSDKHLVIVQDLGQPYRYFKIKIIDPTNQCGYVELGRIVAGRSFTFTQNEDVTDDFSVSEDDLAYKMKSEGFFRASNERVKVDKLTVKFDKLNTTVGLNVNYVGIRTFTKFVGETQPFLTVLDPGDPYFSLVWGQIDSMPSRNATVNRYISMQFSIQEVY